MTSPLTTTYAVDGMTCAHCVQAVTSELSTLPGVKEVLVELAPGAASQVTVVSDGPISPDAVRGAIDEAGYSLVD